MLTFPDNPTINQEVTDSNRKWRWTGVTWDAVAVTGGTVSGVGIDTGVRALTGNWNSTYNTVSSLSSTWNYQGTDLKALSANWQTAYTMVQSNSAQWAASGSGGAGIISKTYAELKALKDASQLIEGQYYKITDFQLKWWNQSAVNTVVLTSPVIEPLNVLATAVNKFSPLAFSDLYPSDIIYYDFEKYYDFGTWKDFGAINNSKGWIVRRIDTIRNIDIPFDWRNMTVNCCRPDLSSVETWNSNKVYNQYDVVKINNKLYYCAVVEQRPSGTSPLNSDIWRQLSSFNEGLTYFPTDEQWGFRVYKPDGNYLVNLPADPSTRTQKYIFSTNPEGLESVNYPEYVKNIKMGPNSNANVFIVTPPDWVNTENNTFGGSCYGNLFHVRFRGNTAGDYFYQNIISFDTALNNFGSYFGENIIGSVSRYSRNFQNNTFISNTTRNYFPYGAFRNIFENYTSNNLFGGQCNDNRFGSYFTSNILPTYNFLGNTFAPQFKNNNIPEWSFYNNLTLGEFSNNNLALGGGGIGGNVFGAVFRNNTLKGYFNGNVTAQQVYNNVIGYGCEYNTFGSETNNNNIGTDCKFNVIQAGFTFNTIGNFFQFNEISNGFIQITVGNYFQYNKIQSNTLNSVYGFPGQYQNLTNATKVYLSYQKEIIPSYNPRAIYVSYWENGQKVLFDLTA